MKWHQGTINEAVFLAKSKKAIFVVFIEGEDEASVEISNAIESAEVSAQLEQDNFVAIKLKSGSENYKFFVQIYHLVPVPSLFFINDNGVPLEIIASAMGPSELLLKIDLICKKKVGAQECSSNLMETATEQKVQSCNSATEIEEMADPQSSINAEPTSSTSIANPETVMTNSEMVVEPSPASPSATLTPEEKIQRAKKLIELQKLKQLQEEQQRQKERELERRRSGRELQKKRDGQKDLEIKYAQRELMKEKAAEAAAKEKIRQQIAEDRAERKQRDLDLQQKLTNQSQQEQITTQPATPRDNSVARIQFKLPSGGTFMKSFDSASSLSSVRVYVTQNIELPFRNFAMASFFPRRNLSRDDDHKSLVELELVPTAVILILPDKSGISTSVVGSAAGGAGFVSNFISTLLAPIYSMYNYLVGYFSVRRPRNDDRSATGTGFSHNTNPQDPFTAGLSRLTRRTVGGGTSGTSNIRTHGNIRTLHSNRDDNDENNTWNGNSTQQM